jgi:hypothetical protein
MQERILIMMELLTWTKSRWSIQMTPKSIAFCPSIRLKLTAARAKSADEWMSQMKKIHTRTNPKLVGDRRIEILARDSRNELVVATLDSGAEENVGL